MKTRSITFAALPVLLAAATFGADEHGHDHDHGHKPAPAMPATAPGPTTTTAHDHGRAHDHADEHGHPKAASKPAPKHDDHGHAHGEHDEHGHAKAASKPAAKHDDHGHAQDDHGHAKPAEKPAPKHDEHGHDHSDVGHDAHGHAEHGAHSDEVKLTPHAIERYGVRMEKAARRALAATVEVPARVAFDADAIAHVGSAVRGRVTDVKVRVGDVVAKGDPLVVVASPELGEAQGDFVQKRTAVAVARGAVEPAKQALERGRALHAKNEGIALAEVQKREADLRAAEGAVQTAAAALAAAESRLSLLGMEERAVAALAETGRIDPQYVVRAPIEGTVIEREVTLGELVSPDRERMLVLADTSRVWVLADVPEARLGEVGVGSEARIRVTALPSLVPTGRVSHVAPALDPATRTARVRVEVPNPDGKLRPGMFARASIAGGSADAVLAIPDEAVQTVGGGPAVFVPVKGEANTFAKRAVKVGRPVGGFVPVLDGLAEGEEFVAAGMFILKADLGKSEAGHDH